MEPLAEATELLYQVDIASQYEAVRAAHSSIRTDGEHFENLSVLVRGYANLSLMTLHYWNSASQAFLARSLLYGEKLENASKDQDRINAHRAYSMAIFGVHRMALDQLEHMSPEATKRDFETWYDVIRPYCEYDVDRLREIAVEHPEARQLATWLAYRASVEIGDQRRLVASAQRALRDCPFLFQVHSELLTNGSMGAQRWVARNGPLRCQQYMSSAVLTS